MLGSKASWVEPCLRSDDKTFDGYPEEKYRRVASAPRARAGFPDAAYVLSQQHEGWIAMPDHYDDGGYSGGSMDRPALRRLLTEVEAAPSRRIEVVGCAHEGPQQPAGRAAAAARPPPA